MRSLVALALALASPAAAQQTVMPVPLTGTGAGLDSAVQVGQTGSAVQPRASGFYGVTVTLASGQGPGYFMLFDAAAVPADGAVTPMRCFYVDAGPRTTVFASSGYPLALRTGLSWAFSSTGYATKTATAAAFVGVSYKAVRQ